MGVKNFAIAWMDPDLMLHVEALRADGGLGVPCRVPSKRTHFHEDAQLGST